MDDFLHNLRSGKLKQTDRGRRDFTDYKGPQRRVSSDRRKTDYYAKVTNENFALIKETLDALADTQKRIADAMVERHKTEVRIAGSLESIAEMLGRQLGIHDLPTQQHGTDPTQSESGMHEARLTATPMDAPPENEDLGTTDQSDLIGMITTMRDAGDSWEKIARHFDEKKIPTVSGKGKWRGPAIKKFWEANT